LIVIKAILNVVKRNDENLIEKINKDNIVEFLNGNIRELKLEQLNEQLIKEIE
jgi:hypothetical protein